MNVVFAHEHMRCVHDDAFGKALADETGMGVGTDYTKRRPCFVSIVKCVDDAMHIPRSDSNIAPALARQRTHLMYV